MRIRVNHRRDEMSSNNKAKEKLNKNTPEAKLNTDGKKGKNSRFVS